MAGDEASSVHQRAEAAMLTAAADALGVTLERRRLRLPEGTYVEVDGVSDVPQVLVALFPHEGPFTDGHEREVALGALKLITVRQALLPVAQCVLVFSSEAADASLGAHSWLPEAISVNGIERRVVDLADALDSEIRATDEAPPAADEDDGESELEAAPSPYDS